MAAISPVDPAGTPESSVPIDLFVGRESELRELQAGLERALAGSGRLFLLAGDPGIGKTRLADEIATAATARGAQVLWGRCWQGGGAPAYWMWVQMLRAYAQRQAATSSGAAPAARELIHLVPELGDRLSDAATDAASAAIDPEQARFRLFEGISDFLRRAAEQQPLVLIADDIHWASSSSLLLLRYVAHGLRDSRILVVATYREVDLRLQPELTTVVADLLREGRRLLLTGLPREHVAHFVSRLAGRPAPQPLVDSIYRVTEGNPFFVDEVVRLLLAESHARSPELSFSATTRVPDEVREVIRRRLEPLPQEVRDLLSLAAVIGREFDVPLLEAIAPSTVLAPSILEQLGEAARVGAVLAVAERIGRFTFAHALIRDFLHDELSPARRSALHLEVGHALISHGQAAGELRLAEVAHHFCLAAPAGDVGLAIEYATRAGEEALRMLAYEEAASCFGDALRAMDLGGGHDRRRTALLLALGDARWRYGDMPKAAEAFFAAVEQARREGSSGDLARAALGLGKVRIERGAVDPLLIAILEEALAALGDREPALRVHLLGRLTTGLQYAGDQDSQAALAERAVALARTIDDRAALAAALSAQHNVLWQAESARRRAAIAAEIVELAQMSGDRELELTARQMRIADLLVLGNIAGVDSEIAAFSQLAHSQRLARFRRYAVVFRAMRAMLDGRLDDAEALAYQALQTREAESAPSSYFMTQLFLIRSEQGRIGEARGAIEEFVRRSPEQRTFRCALALVYATGGDETAARGAFESLAHADFTDFPRDPNWLLTLSILTDVCATLDDRRRAAVLYDLLRPYAGCHIGVVGGIGYRGAVEHFLGRLAKTIGDREQARQHLERACDEHRRIGALGWFDRSRTELTAVEGITGSPAPRQDGGSPRRPLSPPDDSGEFRRQGDVWLLRLGTCTSRLEDSKGLRYLAHLLAHPGTEFHATDLIGFSRVAGDEQQQRALRQLAGSDAGEILDARAAADYRRRLRELQEELTEANEHNDSGRREQLQAEIEFLSQELSGAIGLGGRRRRAGSQSERARVNVTKVIRSALEKIRGSNDELGRHLDATIRTGTFCSYRPDPSRPVRWGL